jgi:ATP-binding cassette subfamily C exporter for protease/lipase
LLTEYPARISGMSLPRPQGNVQVEGLVAAAPGSSLAHSENISFAMQHADVVGIVGPSAAGKSTLARLLVGIWPAQSGKCGWTGRMYSSGARTNWAACRLSAAGYRVV